MSIKNLINYLSVRGLNTSGRKLEPVARAFAAFELKMNIIASPEEQICPIYIYKTRTKKSMCFYTLQLKKLYPKRTADLFVRNSLASSQNKNVNKIPCEEARMKKLSAFDPRIEGYRLSNSDDVSHFLHKVQIVNKNETTRHVTQQFVQIFPV